MTIASTRGGSVVLARPKMPSRAREGVLWCSPDRKCRREHGKPPPGARGASEGERPFAGGRRVLLDDGFGGALGEDEGGDEVGDEAAAGTEDSYDPAQSYKGGVDVKVVGYSYADAQKLASFFLSVEFLIHN